MNAGWGTADEGAVLWERSWVLQAITSQQCGDTVKKASVTLGCVIRA